MVRIGVVGVGGMGGSHCNALPNVENCEFVGVADFTLGRSTSRCGKTSDSRLSRLSRIVCYRGRCRRRNATRSTYTGRSSMPAEAGRTRFLRKTAFP